MLARKVTEKVLKRMRHFQGGGLTYGEIVRELDLSYLDVASYLRGGTGGGKSPREGGADEAHERGGPT